MKINNIIGFVKNVYKRGSDDYNFGGAASMSFYMMLSIVPLMTIILRFVQFFDLADAWYRDLITSLDESNQLVSMLLKMNPGGTGTLDLFFLIPALWAASQIEHIMLKYAKHAYKITEKERSELLIIILDRVKSLGALALLVISISAGLFVMVYGQHTVEFIQSAVSENTAAVSVISTLTDVLSWPVLLLLFWILISLNYKILLGTSIRFFAALPGGLFASVGTVLVTMVYNVYFSSSFNRNLIYGSLNTIVAQMLWFYAISFVLLMGMQINAELDCRK